MRKYITMALLSTLFLNKIHGTSNALHSMIENEIRVAQTVMHLHGNLSLEKVVDELIKYAKIGNIQYNDARKQLASIKKTLEQKKSEQYNTSWSKFLRVFGKYPEFVVTDIDPAIKMVQDADRSIYVTKMAQYASDTAYIAAKGTAISLTLAAALSAGYVLAGGLNNKNIPSAQKYIPSNPHPSAPKGNPFM